jgi:RNA polymerase sigma-70 factor (ECF subfamily)
MLADHAPWSGRCLAAVPRSVLKASMASDPTSPPRDADWADALEAVAKLQDRSAFAGLFAHFAPRVKAYMRRLGADDGRAEDVAQEVMITVWRRSGLYDRRQAAVSTWIFAIARNKRIDQLRRERRPEIDPSDPSLVQDVEPQAERLVSRSESARHLRAALDALPAEQSQVLRKNFFEDKPHSVIAEELDLPLGTVKSRVRLAFIKLRQTMQEME